MKISVSIHAPAWGATLDTAEAIVKQYLFQSTHPRGVRRAQGTMTEEEVRSFNPRTRVGCDFCTKIRATGI
ncbi:hypothetical protein Holit_02264 [Hollandina sp. SP2]